MNVTIVGATGLVGRTMLRVLHERNFPITTLTLLASPRSAGTVIPFAGRQVTVEPLTIETVPTNTIALFSAGGAASRQWAPLFAERGNVVIDNSSAWRMDPTVPLVVPGVNSADALQHRGVIANPNCSTIQMVPVLDAIHKRYGLQRVVVSTYQSPSGAGQHGVDQLRAELAGAEPASRISPHPLAFNTVFHTINAVGEFSEEEIKMQRETRRILHLPELRIAVTCVRVPTLGGHGESLAIETESPIDPNVLRTELATVPDVVVDDDPGNGRYPMPVLTDGSDKIHVGRIRRDDSVDNGVLLWIVADNLRVGAATNAVRIAELFLPVSTPNA